MSEPLPYVVPGPIGYAARDFNHIVDAARAHLTGQGRAVDPKGKGVLPCNTVYVRNRHAFPTQTDLPVRSIVTPFYASYFDSSGSPFPSQPEPSVFPTNSPRTMPFEAQSAPTFNVSVAHAPVISNTGPEVPLVLLEDIPYGQIGRAVISGYAVCLVEVPSYGFVGSGPYLPRELQYAAPIPGAIDRMVAVPAGPARIIAIEQGAGIKTAVVLLGKESAVGVAAAAFVTPAFIPSGLLPVDHQLGSVSFLLPGDNQYWSLTVSSDVALTSPKNTGGGHCFVSVYATVAGSNMIGGSLHSLGAWLYDPDLGVFARGSGSVGLGKLNGSSASARTLTVTFWYNAHVVDGSSPSVPTIQANLRASIAGVASTDGRFVPITTSSSGSGAYSPPLP